MSARSDDDPRTVPPALAFATSTPAAGGDVDVVLRGVRDRQHLNALTADMERIRGVGAIVVLGYEHPDTPVLRVAVARSIQLAVELRTKLGPTVVSSEHVGGRIEVALADPATVSGRPRAAPRAGHAARGGAGPAPSAFAAPPRTPPPRRPASDRPAGRGPARPWAQPGTGHAWAPSPDRHAGAPPADHRAPAADPVADPAPVLDALGAEDDLSILTLDPSLVVRAAHGGLHGRSERLLDGFVGHHIDDVLPPETYVGLTDRLHDALRGVSGEVEVTSASGDRWYRITVNPVHDGPRIVGCMTVSRDVTRQHEDEALLAELTDVFETSFDRSPTGQALLSPTGQWLRINDALRRLLGREEETLVGHALREVTHPDDVDREQALLHEVLAGGADGYEIEKRVVHGGGDAVRVLARMSPVRTAEGAVRGFIAHVVDAARWEDAGG